MKFFRCSTLHFLVIFSMVGIKKIQMEEVCQARTFHGECPVNSAIVMSSAQYGRMRIGKCIQMDTGLGCQTDILKLVDGWCSGKESCDVVVPNIDLANLKTGCNEMTPYMEVQYECVTVTPSANGTCNKATFITIRGSEGHISSQVAVKTGCGSLKAPWIIEVSTGQTLEMWLIDFGALSRHESSLGFGCQQRLGYIIERNLGSNYTICGDTQRQKHIYTSKTNSVEVVMVKLETEPDFMIKYTVIGCPDLTPPAHAWYKREGSKAVIGCISDDRVWHLYCNRNTWNGIVGNCSKSEEGDDSTDVGTSMPFSSVIFLTAVVCGAILLIIVVIVAAVVYVKKQSIKHQMKLRSDYACTTLQSAQYYATSRPAGYDVTLGRQFVDNQPLVQISDRTLQRSI